jgi:putative acetyltransferase
MNVPPSSPVLRPGRDLDSQVCLEILAEVFAEYEGCVFALDELPEMLAPAQSFRDWGGAFFVVEVDATVVGFVGYAPHYEHEGVFELKKLYLRRAARGRGLGRLLIQTILEECRERGARRVELWSDTRFLTAHAVYERCGFQRGPATRELHDKSNSSEFFYSLDILDRG